MDSNYQKYIWDYFALHAAQRMSSFNFFIILAALMTTGMVQVSQNPSANYAGVALGVSLTIISFTFWKLDQRARYLVKHAETALKFLEQSTNDEATSVMPETLRLFNREEQLTNEIKATARWRIWDWPLSYSKCFGIIYTTFGMVGMLGSGMFLAKILC